MWFCQMPCYPVGLFCLLVIRQSIGLPIENLLWFFFDFCRDGDIVGSIGEKTVLVIGVFVVFVFVAMQVGVIVVGRLPLRRAGI